VALRAALCERQRLAHATYRRKGGGPRGAAPRKSDLGFLYRDIIAPLVGSGRRVIVPDMIGFGLSEKPTREHAHCRDGHTANLTALMRQLDLKRIVLVCHDWGGPTGLSLP
jgi:pimeloyl-ACP methyl ester carboxylesterase